MRPENFSEARVGATENPGEHTLALHPDRRLSSIADRQGTTPRIASANARLLLATDQPGFGRESARRRTRSHESPRVRHSVARRIQTYVPLMVGMQQTSVKATHARTEARCQPWLLVLLFTS